MIDALPEELRHGVEQALRTREQSPRIVRVEPVAGGCIHNGCLIVTDTGSEWFLKWNRTVPPGMFEAEAEGLRALRATGAVRVPEPMACEAPETEGPAWLLMEYVRPGPVRPGSEQALGAGLARLHRSAVDRTFGWSEDNWIGSLPQANPLMESWGEFWRDARIHPQLERARRSGRLRDPVFDRLLEATPGALSHVVQPELLHGDLWQGNTLTAEDGEPVLIDPAVYRGDGEVDLAMSELFGGFGSAFYEAYATGRPITSEYRTYGRDLYQLYYLLVHVNLFGASYESATLAAARRVMEAVG
ncbi:MAG: fructosamine kinase family protein [Gemmatimonadota bacterium]|nr:fructosamine kinase family protein [Gemmatimonadota bacterium]